MGNQALRAIATRLIAVFGLSLAISLVAFLAWGLAQSPGSAKAYDDYWCDLFPEDCYTPEPTATHTATANPTPVPTGSLRASRSSILVRQYVTVSAYNVNSSAAPTTFDIAGPVADRGDCSAYRSGAQGQADERREVSGAGSSVLLLGCAAGTVTVWLISRTGVDLDEISISIKEPTPTPDHAATAEAEETETAVAETAVAETAVAETAVAETAVAETAVAETTVAETAVAETAVAETAVAETATAVAKITATARARARGTATAVARITATARASETATAVALKATQTAVAATATAQANATATAVAATATAQANATATAVAATATAQANATATAVAATATAQANSTPTATPISSGHQADHTVNVVRGAMPPVAAPPGMPNPNQIIPASIRVAVNDWNAKMRPLNKNLSFCFGTSTCPPNTDGYDATVKTVKANKNTKPSDHGTKTDCGHYAACNKFYTEQVTGHIREMTIIIENPAWEYNKKVHMNVFWTDSKPLDNTYKGKECDTDSTQCWSYISATMAHELGHSMGLPDFAEHASLKGIPGVMNPVHDQRELSVANGDIDQLRKIYDGHARH